MTSSRWVFEQLTGNQESLELVGHGAPHGRPRQDPVLRETTRLRADEVYYTGNDVPTRHIFGQRREPFELKGRWSDYYGGQGYAQAMRERAKAFFGQAQVCRITWADVVSVIGIVEEQNYGIEAAGEVEWSLTIAVDSDDFLEDPAELPDPRTPATYVNRIILALEEGLEGIDDLPLEGSVFDAVDSLVSSINGVSAELNKVADQINDFADSSVALLRRFRAGIGQFRTALNKLRNTYDDFQADLALERGRADSELQFWSSQSKLGASSTHALAELAEADRAAQLAERGKIRTIHFAQEGDTWESLSRKYYNDPGRAGDIQEANSVGAGEPPEPGAPYQIPT